MWNSKWAHLLRGGGTTVYEGGGLQKEIGAPKDVPKYTLPPIHWEIRIFSQITEARTGLLLTVPLMLTMTKIL